MEYHQNVALRHDAGHIAWIDYAKGICIVLVVMLYATDLTADNIGREGWLHHLAAFAAPFRMPDFFLVSGLLLPLAIRRGWRDYLDRKVVHFAYFYVLWLTILLAFQSQWIAAKTGWSGVGTLYLKSLVHPYSMLWFIYLLSVFFVVTKLVERVPAPLVWLLAAALQIAQLDTGVKVLDKFAMYYVYFYTGYLLAPRIFSFAAGVSARPMLGLIGLGIWALANGYSVPYAKAPGLGLILAFAGAAAVVALSALLCKTRFAAPLAYCGRNSLVIYLAFFIPLVITERILVRSGWITDVGWMSLIGTAGGVLGALVMHRLVRGTRLRFLFERPERFRLGAIRQERGFGAATR